MAFDRSNFCPGGGGGTAPRIHTYTTTDADTVIATDDYFLEAQAILSAGDLIYVHGDTDGTPFYRFYPVNLSESGSVDVADGTAVTATDTE